MEAKGPAKRRLVHSVDWLHEGFLDIPWGILAFLVLAIGGLVWTAFSTELKASDYLTAVSGGAGLLAVGHGIREHGKLRGKADSPAPDVDPTHRAR